MQRIFISRMAHGMVYLSPSLGGHFWAQSQEPLGTGQKNTTIYELTKSTMLKGSKRTKRKNRTHDGQGEPPKIGRSFDDERK